MAKDAEMLWREKVARMTPAAPKQETSPARARIRSAFDEITAARARGVTWQQFADLLAGEGVVGTEGEPLTADNVRALYHNERASRGLRKKRRTKKPLGLPAAPTRSAPIAEPPAEPESTQPPTDKPRSRADEKIAELDAKWEARKRKLPRIM